ncbi:MAG: SagB/ThcOx family dehydrogenase [Chloroflexi bacterium]|nr:SagB/ThcOx family dehydrogenase [Chloroflexota bacterium]
MAVHITLRLHPEAHLIPGEEPGTLHIERDMFRYSLKGLGSGGQAVLQTLATQDVDHDVLNKMVAAKDGMPGVFAFMPNLSKLINAGVIVHTLYHNKQPLVRLRPLSSHYQFLSRTPDAEQRFILSRFAVIRRDGETLSLTTPLSAAALDLLQPSCLAAIGQFQSAVSLDDLIQSETTHLAKDTLTTLMQFLLTAQALSLVIDGQPQEDQDRYLRQWDAHNLYFHSQTRLGRAHDVYGMSYRFLGEIEQAPVFKDKVPEATNIIPLYIPNLDDAVKEDRPFADVVESRQSRPQHAESPITIEQVGEFLYRSARSRHTFSFDVEANSVIETVYHSNRPYPNGGASYEIELYLSVSACQGLEPGFYHYQPEQHYLVHLSGITHDVRAILWQAQRAWLPQDDGSLPQVLITYGARFARINWKYQSIAYALTLKNVGVLMQTMSLVAEALGLAGCPIGGGNADVFAHAIGADYSEESSVGEFLLGSRVKT